MGRNRKNRKPTFADIRRDAEKRPRIAGDSESLPNTHKPVWRFGLMDIDGPWGWRHIAASEWWDIRQKLADCERRTWQEILQDSSHGSHPIPVERLIAAARRRLEELKLDDLDEVFSLRLSGPKRVFGIRSGDALQILWWDPEHQICPSPKKHT